MSTRWRAHQAGATRSRLSTTMTSRRSAFIVAKRIFHEVGEGLAELHRGRVRRLDGGCSVPRYCTLDQGWPNQPLRRSCPRRPVASLARLGRSAVTPRLRPAAGSGAMDRTRPHTRPAIPRPAATKASPPGISRPNTLSHFPSLVSPWRRFCLFDASPAGELLPLFLPLIWLHPFLRPQLLTEQLKERTPEWVTLMSPCVGTPRLPC